LTLLCDLKTPIQVDKLLPCYFLKKEKQRNQIFFFFVIMSRSNLKGWVLWLSPPHTFLKKQILDFRISIFKETFEYYYYYYYYYSLLISFEVTLLIKKISNMRLNFRCELTYLTMQQTVSSRPIKKKKTLIQGQD